jgi:hypothetical protein
MLELLSGAKLITLAQNKVLFKGFGELAIYVRRSQMWGTF